MKLRRSRESVTEGLTAPEEVPPPDPELQRLLDEEDQLEAQVRQAARPPALSRADLVQALCDNDLVPVLGVPYAQRREDVRAMLDFIELTITDALVAGRTVQLGGFLKLEPTQTKTRNGRNPRTGESIVVPSKRVVKVRVLKHLADRVRDGA